MNNSDILIVGAGAAGLMAARTLAKAGKQVTVLEARERCGGRIYTMAESAVLSCAELGAEFIHGDLPVTLQLLKDAGIPAESANAEMWRYQNGRFTKEEGFMEDWDLLMDKLEQLEEDVYIDSFLKSEFPGEEYAKLRDAVDKFVLGYDTADIRKASSFALRQEWKSEDTGAQHRVNGGYGTMTNYLEEEIENCGGSVYLNTIVKEIHWQPGNVRVMTNNGTVFTARQIILALPLGVLQAPAAEQAAVSFYPPIPQYTGALQAMGFGAVIKILMEFDEQFWLDQSAELSNMGYLFSDEEIPTWWTQVPKQSKVLTGWIGGPDAAKKKDLTDEQIINESIQSLGKIFNLSAEDLKMRLLGYKVLNWTAEPFTLGSYAYDTVEAPGCRKILNTPIDHTLFFAGEYLYEGAAMGTVEAALASGQQVANSIIRVIQ